MVRVCCRFIFILTAILSQTTQASLPPEDATSLPQDAFRLLYQIVLRPPLDSEWPETCAPRELIDRLVRFGMGPGVFHFWKDDLSQQILDNESDICSGRFPFELRYPNERRHIYDAYSTLINEFPRLLPQWIWLAQYGDRISMGAYTLEADGRYRRLSLDEAERINRETLIPEGEVVPSTKALIDRIYNSGQEVIIVYSARGEDITASIIPHQPPCLFRKEAPSTLRAMERMKPAYVTARSILSDPLQPCFVRRQDGSWVRGWNPMNWLIYLREKDDIHRALRWNKYPRF